MPEVLFKFSSEVQTKKINPEKPNSDTCVNTTLRCIRAGVNRFVKSKKLFQGMQKIGKKGKGVIKHKAIIEAEDLQRLNDYFSRHMQLSSVIPKRFVMFNIMFYKCRRARENFASMTVDTF